MKATTPHALQAFRKHSRGMSKSVSYCSTFFISILLVLYNCLNKYIPSILKFINDHSKIKRRDKALPRCDPKRNSAGLGYVVLFKEEILPLKVNLPATGVLSESIFV